MNLEEYNQKKAEFDTIQRQADRADGAVKQLLFQLKEKHDCKTVQEAKELLTKLKQEQKQLQGELEQKQAILEQKWAEKIS